MISSFVRILEALQTFKLKKNYKLIRNECNKIQGVKFSKVIEKNFQLQLGKKRYSAMVMNKEETKYNIRR